MPIPLRLSPLVRELATPAVQVEELHMPARIRLQGHGHACPHLCVILSGAFEERGGRVPTLAAAGTLRASPAGDVHDLRFSAAGAHCLLLLLDEGITREAALPRERSFLRTGAALAIAQSIRETLDDSPVLVELHVLELVAHIAGSRRTSRHGSAPRWLLRVRDLLHATPAQPPTTAELAAVAQLHPVYVARAFRRWYGCSIASYARRLRLEHARRTLIESPDSLARVAALCGFADQSHLTRAMRRGLGMTPATLRRQVARVQDSARSAS